jgi:hypothetical protein
VIDPLAFETLGKSWDLIESNLVKPDGSPLAAFKHSFRYCPIDFFDVI